MADDAERNKSDVISLYDALRSQDIPFLTRLFAPHLDWWFHGPPSHQHLMAFLTGRPHPSSFHFSPVHVVSFGSIVVVEGIDESRSVTWVHAWTVSSDGFITQLREYINTSLTVTRLLPLSLLDASASSSHRACSSLWQSKLCDHKTVPGVVLAL